MLKLHRMRRVKKETVDFCDRCSSVCDSDCCRTAVIERAREQVLAYRSGRVV